MAPLFVWGTFLGGAGCWRIGVGGKFVATVVERSPRSALPTNPLQFRTSGHCNSLEALLFQVEEQLRRMGRAIDMDDSGAASEELEQQVVMNSQLDGARSRLHWTTGRLPFPTVASALSRACAPVELPHCRTSPQNVRTPEGIVSAHSWTRGIRGQGDSLIRSCAHT